MTDNQLDRQVKQAFEHLVPDVLDSVLSDCREEKGTVIMINNKKRFWRTAIGIAAALVLVLGSTAGAVGYKAARTPSSVVSLDVNPSIEIEVNKNEMVLSVTAKNDDAEAVIGDMDFEGCSLEVTVNALIGSMVENGYLNEMANSILISVDSKNPKEAAAIQAKLSSEVNGLLVSGSFSGSILSQVVSSDDELKTLADENSITLGKAQFIRSIAEKNPRYEFEDLVALSINDLNLLCSFSNMELDNVSAEGTASDKKYIGQFNAIDAAINHAGLSASLIDRIKAEMDVEDGLMVYEVDFDADSCEYKYDVDAVTGDIISSHRKFADAVEEAAEDYADGWEAYGEQQGDNWESWGEQYGNSWESWGEKYGDAWEQWAEKYFDF